MIPDGTDGRMATLYEVSELISKEKLIIGDGYRAKNSELGAAGLPFARAGNVNEGFRFGGADHFPEENLARVGPKASQPGDVVFTSKGTVGRFAFVRPNTPRFVYSPQLCYWRSSDHDAIDPRFLYFWMFGHEFSGQFKGVSAQTDMAEYVNLRDQRRMHITLPPIAIQRAVAHILGTLDDKIELNRRMNETLEAMARALFKSWFVDFDPVRAKAEGRDPRTGRLAGLPSHLAALFPDRFEDSDLGEIPAGWKVAPIGNHITADRGLSYNGAGLRDDGTGLPMHNLNSIYEGGGYKHDGIKFYAGEYREKHLVHPGDLIITNTEQGFDHLLIGHAAIVPDRYGARGLFSHHIFRIGVKAGSPFTPHYLVQLFNDPLWHQVISGFSNGTTINMLPLDSLAIPLVVVPPEAVVAEFSRLAATVHSRVEASGKESLTLAALRDALLPRLISGEIRVNVVTPFAKDGT